MLNIISHKKNARHCCNEFLLVYAHWSGKKNNDIIKDGQERDSWELLDIIDETATWYNYTEQSHSAGSVKYTPALFLAIVPVG